MADGARRGGSWNVHSRSRSLPDSVFEVVRGAVPDLGAELLAQHGFRAMGERPGGARLQAQDLADFLIGEVLFVAKGEDLALGFRESAESDRDQPAVLLLGDLRDHGPRPGPRDAPARFQLLRGGRGGVTLAVAEAV